MIMRQQRQPLPMMSAELQRTTSPEHDLSAAASSLFCGAAARAAAASDRD